MRYKLKSIGMSATQRETESIIEMIELNYNPSQILAVRNAT